MDLVATVGTYNLVSMMLNSYGVQLDEEADGRLPDEYPWRADLLLVDANQLDDVANASKQIGVMVRGSCFFLLLQREHFRVSCPVRYATTAVVKPARFNTWNAIGSLL